MNSDPRVRPQLRVWWTIWGGVLAGLVLIYVFLGRGPLPPSNGKDLVVNLAGFVPLFVSVIIRWLVLPRFDSLLRALPMFVAGIGLAQGCGVLGIFLGGPYRDALFVLGVLGIAQYAPFFAHRLVEPKAKGFVPNN
jgi:hypothetical protein